MSSERRRNAFVLRRFGKTCAQGRRSDFPNYTDQISGLLEEKILLRWTVSQGTIKNIVGMVNRFGISGSYGIGSLRPSQR
jgi:hypothetical protein